MSIAKSSWRLRLGFIQRLKYRAPSAAVDKCITCDTERRRLTGPNRREVCYETHLAPQTTRASVWHPNGGCRTFKGRGLLDGDETISRTTLPRMCKRCRVKLFHRGRAAHSWLVGMTLSMVGWCSLPETRFAAGMVSARQDTNNRYMQITNLRDLGEAWG